MEDKSNDKKHIYYYMLNNMYRYNLVITNVNIIPVKHLTMVNMFIQNDLVSNDHYACKVYVTEKTIEKYNIDISKTYIGSFNKFNNKVWLPTIVNLKYDNGIPSDTSDIYIEEKERQINQIYDKFVEQYGSNFMDNFLHKLRYKHSIKDIKPYINNDFNIWTNFVNSMKPIQNKGVILHKDVQYEELFSKLETLYSGLYRPREERPVTAGDNVDTLYVESYDGIADIYDYGLDHERYTDYEFYDKPHYPYMEGIDFINFK